VDTQSTLPLTLTQSARMSTFPTYHLARSCVGINGISHEKRTTSRQNTAGARQAFFNASTSQALGSVRLNVGRRGMRITASTSQGTAENKAVKSKGNVTNLYAERAFQVEVELGERSVGDYVTLPAKKYSVLDSEAVKKLGDNKFRVSGGQQKFPMGQSGEPVGIIEIEVGDGCVQQRLVEAEVINAKGKAMSEMNKVLKAIKFLCVVGAEVLPDTETHVITCRIALDAQFTEGIMTRIPEGKLNQLVGSSLGVVMPWFLCKLRDDYMLWASGDEEKRGQMGKGEMQKMTAGMMSTLKTGVLPDGVQEIPVGKIGERMTGIMPDEAP